MGNQSSRDPFDDDDLSFEISCISLSWISSMGQSSSIASPPKGKKVLLQKLSSADKTGVLNLVDQDLKPNSSVWQKISLDGLLPKLKSLDISGNAIKSLPGEISMMANLKSLHAARCSLQRTHDISPLIKLVQINIDSNDLEADVLAPLPMNLTKLSIANNHFKAIPPTLGSLIHVVELNLSGNRIESTNGLGMLLALVDLNLDCNMLAEVSEDLCLLLNLRHISLKSNRLGKNAISREGQSIPEGVFTQTSLDSIDLSQNPAMTRAIAMDFQGVDLFLERRKKIKDRAFHGGAIMDVSLFGNIS